jgi:calnexin
MGKKMKLIYLLCVLVILSKSNSITCQDDSEPIETKPIYIQPIPIGPHHFVETFENQMLDTLGWIQSLAKKDDVDQVLAKYDGIWAIEPSMNTLLEGDLGLVLKSKAKHSAISKRISKSFHFSNKKPLIVQYEVKFQNPLECGGAYVKLLAHDSSFQLDQFHDKTGFSVMFGPDKCGTDNKYHFIVRYKNPVSGVIEEKHAKKSQLIDAFFNDGKTHLFTLVVRPDNTFQMMIDTTEVNSGSLLTDMSPAIVPDKEMLDPNDVKPEGWDEREKIEDPEASRPEDWDESQPKQIEDTASAMPEGWLQDEMETIPDPDSVMPDDWDIETDGEWEAAKIENPACKDAPGCGKWSAPMITNPAYKGKWLAPLIDNVNYQGKWEPRMIPNPNYFEETDPFSKLLSFDTIGLELWSMTDDIYFDNFIITDDESVSNQFSLDSWAIKKDLESTSSSSDSVIDALTKATHDKPWLWALYVLVVLVPVVLIVVFCCGSKKTTDSKKTDAVVPDEETEEVVNEPEEQEESDEANKPSKSDLEDEEASPKKTNATKRRARKD